jgi:hypothetical protein
MMNVHRGLASLRRLAHAVRRVRWTGHRPVLQPCSGYQPGQGFCVSKDAPTSEVRS